MDRYKVDVVVLHPKFGNIRTHIYTEGKSSDDAEAKAVAKFKTKAIAYWSERVGRWIDWLLDLCYKRFPDIYMDCWEPDIDKEDLINCLRQNPKTAVILGEDNGERVVSRI